VIFPHPTIKVGECRCVLRTSSAHRELSSPYFKRKQVKFEGDQWKANRLSYHLNREPIKRTPERDCDYVLHECGNDWCVEPSHLYLGTLAQNAADCYRHIPDMRERLSNAQKIIWSDPSRKARQSAALEGNKNVLGKRWKLSEASKNRLKEGWTDERRMAQAIRMADLNRAREK